MFPSAYFGLSVFFSYLTLSGFQTYHYLYIDGHFSRVNLFHTTPLDSAPTEFEIPHVPQFSLSSDFPQYQRYPN